LLIEHGGHINQQTNDTATPLIQASYEGSMEAVRFLVDAKAEVNTLRGMTQLELAQQQGHQAVVSVLQQ